MKALIVDDSRTACRVLARLLARYQIEADSVPSAEEALERLRHHKPDVIFMDHAMPGMDGLETVRLLKANPDTAVIPVVMYTSREGEVYVGQARALGAVDVLSKDSLEDSLEETIQRLRQLRRRREAETAPEAAPAAPIRDLPATDDWSGKAQAELTRQMYLILTEQQISQKNQTARISRGLDHALSERLDGMASRLEAAADLRAEAMENRLRAVERRLVARSGAFAGLLIVAVGMVTAWATNRPAEPDVATVTAMATAAAELREASSLFQARLSVDPPSDAPVWRVETPGVAAIGADGAALGWIVGRGEEGSHYDAISSAGFLFGVSADGTVGWPMPVRYFASPGCNGPAMVRDLPAVILRGHDMRLWYTGTAAGGEILRPASALNPEGECREIDSAPMELRVLLRNDPGVTGVGPANEPVRISAG